MKKPSEKYSEITGKNCFYNIMPIENICSVLKHGIVCYNQAKEMEHTSVAMNEVQTRRHNVCVSKTMMLHDYANLYFTYMNPMMYKRKDSAEQLCILKISSKIIDVPGAVISDMNAASPMERFYSAFEGPSEVDFGKVFKRFWTHENPYEREIHKKIKCAEVLIPFHILLSYIISACVCNESSKQELLQRGFASEIAVEPTAFFR